MGAPSLRGAGSAEATDLAGFTNGTRCLAAIIRVLAVLWVLSVLLETGSPDTRLFGEERPPEPSKALPPRTDSVRNQDEGVSLQADFGRFFEKYCIRCHGPKQERAELRLDKALASRSSPETLATIEKIVDRLEADEMPPEDQPRPAADESLQVVARLKSILAKSGARTTLSEHRVTVRRLNRAEYNNTIRDLIGVDFKPAEDFPSDDVGYGFDNIGDVLSLSPLLMEKYLDAAETIVQRAIVADVSTIAARVRRRDADDLQTTPAARLAGEHGLKLTSNGRVFAKFEFPGAGEYVLRAEAAGDQAGDEPAKMEFRLDSKAVATFDVPVPSDSLKVYETRVRLEAGRHEFAAAFVNDYYHRDDPDPRNRDRNLYVRYLEVETPLSVALENVPETHSRLVPCRPDSERSAASCARAALKPIVRRAYRRPVQDEEIEPLVGLVESAVQQGETFEYGVQIALEAVLVSPSFLFRVEREFLPNDPPETIVLRNYELASRLSYFLWSSMPDDELFALAEKGTLRSDDVLERQVKRMLKDPKADALAENFASQWLQLRNLDEAAPDPDRFPEFDEPMRRDMRRETMLFFSAILREDRSLFDFIDGRFTFVNERLARLYGIPGVQGDEFREVSLSGQPRAGVMTQASVLTVTSSATHTSPVKRGKWVLENILGAPPPPPPPDVPDFEIAKRAAPNASLRQQLEIHRSNASCAVCHKEMDTLGLGFENFDPIGRWREQDGTNPVDAAGTLPSGESFQGPLELARLLRKQQDEFRRCLIEKLLTYALGRGLEFSDRSQCDKIGEMVMQHGDRFAALVVEIVKSEPFRMQAGQGERQ